MKTTADTINKAVIIKRSVLYFFEEVDAFIEEPENYQGGCEENDR